MPKAKRKVSVKGLADEVDFAEQPNSTVIITDNKSQSVVSRQDFDSKFEIVPEIVQEPDTQ